MTVLSVQRGEKGFMETKISVIIPVYHPRREFIDRLMDSIVRQTIGVEQLEILLVVDGDTSVETREMLQAWEERFPDQIMLIFYEENRKPGYARTLGMSHASGEYIAFADQDDWLSLEMYQTLYETAVRHNCEVVGSNYTRDVEYHRPEKKRIGEKKGTVVVEIESVDDRKKFLMDGLYGGYWAALYSRQFLEENDIYFPEGLTYDDNFFGGLVSYSVKRFAAVDEAFYHWYNNVESITVKRNGTSYLDRLRIEIKKLGELEERGLFSVYHDEIECQFFTKFFINTMHLMFSVLDETPYEVYLYMAATMRKLFPGYRNNSYITEKEYTWCSFEAYPLLYDYYQNTENSGRILQLLEEVPKSVRKTCWFDLIDHPVTEEQLFWWKRLYLLLPNI